MSDGYPFIFQMIDKSESDEYLIQTLQYRFKSDIGSEIKYISGATLTISRNLLEIVEN